MITVMSPSLGDFVVSHRQMQLVRDVIDRRRFEWSTESQASSSTAIYLFSRCTGDRV